jgi:hypothetical protein
MRLLTSALVCAALLFAGCGTAYYAAMERIGIPKREILVERVGEAREAQAEAKVQFASALEQFLAVSKVPVPELKPTYDRLNDALKSSEARAKEVNDRISSIENVASALFSEWNAELAQYTNPTLRSQSERQLAQTRQRYNELMRLMRSAAARMEPVLSTFRDQVLFLKHNLNAQAIAALGPTSRALESDIQRLIGDMESSIREADAFIAAMRPVE